MTPEEVDREDRAAAAPLRPGGGAPRPAGPGRSLLSRLQAPAGKAIALVAVQSAVLLGMGLTSQLATARPLPKNPFEPGPCVLAADRVAGGDARAARTAGSTSEHPPRPEVSGTPDPRSPEPDGPRAALDLDGAVDDLLAPGDRRQRLEGSRTSPGASPAPSPSPSAGRERTAPAGEGSAGAAPGESADPAPQPSGRRPYPCPTHDAEALADAEDEPVEALLPDAPWRLRTSLLALYGLDYRGIVKVRTHGGRVKEVLKFTAEAVDIRDLHQIVEGHGGSRTHVRAREGSTSTIRNGTVTMYTERLEGKLFGVVPVTFSPSSPPPLDTREVFFTDATVVQAGQFGGTLHIPGMRLGNGG